MAQTSPLPQHEDSTVVALPDPIHVWPDVKTALLAPLNATARDMMNSLELCLAQGGVVTLSVPTTFLRKWVETYHARDLLRLWQKHLPRVQRVEVTIRGCARAPGVPDPGIQLKRVFPPSSPPPAQLAVKGAAAVDKPAPESIPLKTIVGVVARHYGLQPDDLTNGRAAYLAHEPRKVALYLAKVVGDYKQHVIGAHFKCSPPTVSVAASSLVEMMSRPNKLGLKLTVDRLKQAVLDEHAKLTAA